MNLESRIRAWRDPLYRMSMSEEARAELGRHPSGDGPENDGEDWIYRLGVQTEDDCPEITGTAGCGSAGCSKVVCTDPCGTMGCNLTDKPGCTLGGCKAEDPTKAAPLF